MNPEQRAEAVPQPVFQLSYLSLSPSDRPQLQGREAVQPIESRLDLGGGEAGMNEGIWGEEGGGRQAKCAER